MTTWQQPQPLDHNHNHMTTTTTTTTTTWPQPQPLDHNHMTTTTTIWSQPQPHYHNHMTTWPQPLDHNHNQLTTTTTTWPQPQINNTMCTVNCNLLKTCKHKHNIRAMTFVTLFGITSLQTGHRICDCSLLSSLRALYPLPCRRDNLVVWRFVPWSLRFSGGRIDT